MQSYFHTLPIPLRFIKFSCRLQGRHRRWERSAISLMYNCTWDLQLWIPRDLSMVLISYLNLDELHKFVVMSLKEQSWTIGAPNIYVKHGIGKKTWNLAQENCGTLSIQSIYLLLSHVVYICTTYNTMLSAYLDSYLLPESSVFFCQLRKFNNRWS